MAIHQLVLCRAGQRVLRVGDDVREHLRRAGRTARRSHEIHYRSYFYLHYHLRHSYPRLPSEAFRTQAATHQQGLLPHGCLKKLMGIALIFWDVRT